MEKGETLGFFGGPDKSLKKLKDDLMGARISMGMMGRLPAANVQIALQRVPPSVAAAVRAAKSAGFAQEARDMLQEEFGEPQESEAAETLRQRILEAALREL
jgi:hypothetical protein